MEQKIVIKESVRGIVEYVLKSGSLDDRFMSIGRAMEGTIAHGKLQKDNENIYEDYQKEVKLQWGFIRDNIELIIEGRTDGIIKESNNVIIEEIKSTYKSLIYIEEDYNELHWAQGKFYGYIYCKENNLKKIRIRLSYYDLNTDEVKSFEKEFILTELEAFVSELVERYMKAVLLKIALMEERNKSIEEMEFPFPTYRKGQRELAVTCYNTIRNNGVLFAQAPTGIGKTISTIFPAIKGLANNMGERIVYLTSKTITRVVAEEAYAMLIKNGLKIKVVSITAKEKSCLNDEVKCNGDDCKFAKDYFSKVDNAIEDIIRHENMISRDVIRKYSEKYQVCPFELSLDLTEWCHGVICDYNYAFDNRVRLKRIFQEDNKSNVILVDECHNLIDRARAMYSAEIFKSDVIKINKILKGKVPALYKASNLINKELIEIRRELEEKSLRITYHNIQYKELIKAMKLFIKEADEYLVKGKGTEGYDEVMDFYFKCRSFVSINELYSDKYTTIIEKLKNDLKVKIFCIDPSDNIKEIISSSYATILFSATLWPMKYYIDLLGGDEKSYRLRLDSPFKKENLKTFISPLNMKYTMRENNIPNLCELIYKFKEKNPGNHIVFLPSFEYLKKVAEIYQKIYSDEDILIQKENINEVDKEEFLANFMENSKVLAFAVVGGMFSEGVDLPGKRLIGAVIVGVGFPKISIENDIIANYFAERGFDYAYTYSGINKILQCAGRVIRTEKDKGSILLVDSRYLSKKYKDMLPPAWKVESW